MVTIKQIAQEAGVSITTVSNVIKGNTAKVSPDTQFKIEQLLKKRNYIPRFGLRALNNKTSHMIGVIVHTPSFLLSSMYEHPFYGTILGLLERSLRSQGYYMMICSSKDIHEIITLVMGWNVDGILGISMPLSALTEIMNKTGKPVVSIDMNVRQEPNPGELVNITSKDLESGKIMVEYLIQKGVQDILFFCNTRDGADYRRYMGANDAYQKGYHKKRKLTNILIPPDYDDRLLMFDVFKNQADNGIAFFFSTDLNAVEAINFYENIGIRIPEQISIVGCDDDTFARLCPCGLTTIRVNIEEKAKKAVELLMCMIQGSEILDRHPFIEVMLIERGSVK
ncbi:MAG: LacI family DNA-binding transcriptional regulator [Lachnospiraceae bacterium]